MTLLQDAPGLGAAIGYFVGAWGANEKRGFTWAGAGAFAGIMARWATEAAQSYDIWSAVFLAAFALVIWWEWPKIRRALS